MMVRRAALNSAPAAFTFKVVATVVAPNTTASSASGRAATCNRAVGMSGNRHAGSTWPWSEMHAQVGATIFSACGAKVCSTRTIKAHGACAVHLYLRRLRREHHCHRVLLLVAQQEEGVLPAQLLLQSGPNPSQPTLSDSVCGSYGGMHALLPGRQLGICFCRVAAQVALEQHSVGLRVGRSSA